jgi:pyruvate formate-lyase activating enzyme-like uncharacterized protein
MKRKEAMKMPEKVVFGYEASVVEALIRDILDLIKNFDEDELKAWIKETYPNPDEVYG